MINKEQNIKVLLSGKLLKKIIAQARVEGFDNELMQFSRELIKRQLNNETTNKKTNQR